MTVKWNKKELRQIQERTIYIGDYLKFKRLRANLTTQQLSDATGVSYPVIHGLERGLLEYYSPLNQSKLRAFFKDERMCEVGPINRWETLEVIEFLEPIPHIELKHKYTKDLCVGDIKNG
jgi:hypothetical protein